MEENKCETCDTAETPAEEVTAEETEAATADPKKAARELLDLRRRLADAEEKTIFGGRLGEYRYYDMDAVLLSALALVEKELH